MEYHVLKSSESEIQDFNCSPMCERESLLSAQLKNKWQVEIQIGYFKYTSFIAVTWTFSWGSEKLVFVKEYTKEFGYFSVKGEKFLVVHFSMFWQH